MNTQKLNMIKIGEGIFAKVVRKGSCTSEFNNILKEVGSGFTYLPISSDDPAKMNGYNDMIVSADIEIDYTKENLIIIRHETNNH